MKPDALAKKKPDEKPARWPTRGTHWRQAVIKSLEKLGNFTLVAEAVGISRRSIRRLREEDPVFEEEVAEAMDCYIDKLEAECDRRGFTGWQRPVYQGGELVGHTPEFSDKLAELRLRALRPSLYREAAPQQNGGNTSFIVKIGIQTRDGDPRPPATRRHVLDVSKTDEG